MNKKILCIGQVNEPLEEYSNFSTHAQKFEIVSARSLEEAITLITETKKSEPIKAIVFARSVLIDNYSKDKGNIVSMLVIDIAKKSYPKLKVVSMVLHDKDTKGKTVAILGSYVAEKSDWVPIFDFISPV